MNKYNAKKTEIDGIKFDSKKEARRYSELRLMVKANEILNLEMQPRYDIVVNGKKIGFYKADFRYKESHNYDAPWIVEDVKGCRKGCAYSMFRLKKKLVEAIYGIEVVEI